MSKYTLVETQKEADEWLSYAQVGARAVYWNGPCGPDPGDKKQKVEVEFFNHLHRLFHQGKIHLFQERIPRRGFDFIIEKR